jgi:hypothetical protein
MNIILVGRVQPSNVQRQELNGRLIPRESNFPILSMFNHLVKFT